MEREAGLRRRFVLVVSNVVAAIGLVGLLSYAFLGTSGTTPSVTTASGPTLRIREAQKAPELVLEEVVRVPPVIDKAPGILRAAIDDTSARLAAAADRPSPATTGAVLASFEMRRLVIGPESARTDRQKPALVRQASLTPGLAFPSRSVFEGAGLTEDRDDLSAPDTVIQEEGLTRPHEQRRPGIAVPLDRAEDGNASLRLAFTPPAFVVRDVDAEDRADLIEADEVAKQKEEEKVVAKDRRIARERYCMAAAVYYEARGEPLAGQLAVAQVVMNRVASKRYPNTICGVVFQGEDRRNRCQFSFACDGRPERPRPGAAWNQALKIAKRFEAGERYSKVAEATHYHADYVNPRWSRSMHRVSKIGRHIFLDGV